MKKKYMGLGALALALIITSTTLTTTVDATVEITQYPSFKPGDYFKYDINVSGFIDQMKVKFGENATVNLEAKSLEIKYDREETVNLYGENYDCIVSIMTMDMKINLSGTMRGINYTSDMHMVEKVVSWDTKEDVKKVKEESAQYMYMNITMLGQKTYSENQTIRDTEYKPPVSQYNIPVRVGDSWQTVTEKKIHTTNKQRTNGGSWQVTENDKTESATMIYQAVEETHIRTFDTLKIKETDSSFSNNCTYAYITSDGIPVKIEVDSNNTPLFSAELTEYNYQSSEPRNSGTPGFEAGMAIVAVSMASLAYTYKRKN